MIIYNFKLQTPKGLFEDLLVMCCVCSGTSSGGGWVQALLALTDSHLLWWEAVPATPQQWSLPARSLRLIQTRLVSHRSPIYQTEQYSICIRSAEMVQIKYFSMFINILFRLGGEEGVTANVIAFDSKSDQGTSL